MSSFHTPWPSPVLIEGHPKVLSQTLLAGGTHRQQAEPWQRWEQSGVGHRQTWGR